MKETISVIIPVYNVEKYIDECIQSILNQTYTKWEMILVDDGSPDSSGQICDKYSEKDARIRVIHKENGGLSDARNAALKIASGEYLTFVDSDDYLFSTCLEDMIGCIKKYNADVVQCDYARDESLVGEKTSEDEVVILKDFDIMRDYLRFGSPNVLACGKLYRAELFNDIQFPKGRLDEDNFTTYKTLFKSKVFVNINRRLYYYRENQESISHRAFKKDRFSILDCVPEIREYLKNCGYNYSEDIDYYELRELIQLYNDAISAKADEQFANDLKDAKKKIFSIARRVKKKELKYRLIIFLIYYCEPFYKCVVTRNRKRSFA